MSEYNLGTARGVIEIEYAGGAAERARRDIEETGSSASRSEVNLRKAGNTAGVAGGLIAAGMALATKTALDFEQSMSNVAAASGASGDQLEQLSEKALQLGKDTAFSAGESAMAMEELVKAGLSVEDVLNGATDATVALAAAGGIDMPTAASIASSAMNNFSIEAENMAHVADLLAGAANLSATDVQGIGEAFKYVAPLAASTGVSIEDTSTAITALANAGIEGSMAGTTLRGMLQNLNPSSQAAATAMKELGIITEDQGNRFFDAQGNTKSLAEISGVLAESLDGLSDSQKSQALTTIFGDRAMTGAIALAKVGEDGFNDLSEAIGDVSAQEVAKQKMDNLAGSIEQLKGSAETLGIVLGTVIIPFMKDIVDGVTAALNVFLNLPGPVQKAVVAFLAIASAGLLAIALIVKFIQVQKAIQLALAGTRLAFISTWVAALGPIGLVVAAIAVVIAVIVLLWKKSETFRTIVTAVWNAVKAAVLTVVSWFTSLPALFSTVWSAITNVFRVHAAFWSAIWNAVKAVFQAIWSAIAAVVRAYVGAVVAVVTGAWNALRAVTTAAWNALKTVVSNAVSAVVERVRSLKDRVVSVFSNAGSWLFDAGKKIVQGVINGITSMAGKISGAFKSVAGGLARFLPGSPVKEGPLTVLNNGGAGKKIVEMLADGVLSMKVPLEQSLSAVVGAPILAGAGGGNFAGNAGFAPSPPAAVASSGSSAGARGNIELTVINPIPEPASESLTRSMQKVAYLGFGSEG
jgi:TP901 family phage tail tape measure protein